MGRWLQHHLVKVYVTGFWSLVLFEKFNSERGCVKGFVRPKTSHAIYLRRIHLALPNQAMAGWGGRQDRSKEGVLTFMQALSINRRTKTSHYCDCDLLKWITVTKWTKRMVCPCAKQKSYSSFSDEKKVLFTCNPLRYNKINPIQVGVCAEQSIWVKREAREQESLIKRMRERETADPDW